MAATDVPYQSSSSNAWIFFSARYRSWPWQPASTLQMPADTASALQSVSNAKRTRWRGFTSQILGSGSGRTDRGGWSESITLAQPDDEQLLSGEARRGEKTR